MKFTPNKTLPSLLFTLTTAIITHSSTTTATSTLTSNLQGSPQQLTHLCASRTDGRSNCEVELDVPSSCLPSATTTTPCPIIFFLHGSGGTNNGFATSSDVHTHNFIGIYPQGEGGWNTGPKSTNLCPWDDFECTQDPDEGDFIRAIIEEVKGQFGDVPMGNIYAIGNSNGAALAHRLAANAGDELPITGIVTKVTQLLASPSRSGPGVLNYNQPVAGGRKVSVLNIMGTSDGLIPYNGGTSSVFGGDEAFVLMSAHASMETWAAHNGCNSLPTSTSMHSWTMNNGESGLAEYLSYGGCASGYLVEHYAIEGGGHNAGGASIDGQKIDYDIAYDFVRRVEAGISGTNPPSVPTTSSPTKSPSPPAPSPPSSACVDDPTWTGKYNAEHDCDYISDAPETRCNWENSSGVKASEACLLTCNANNCVGSTASPTKSATNSPTSSPTQSPLASPTPPSPPSSCQNDSTWSGKFNPEHTCEYISENLARCIWENTDGITANEACPLACNPDCSNVGNGPMTNAPTNPPTNLPTSTPTKSPTTSGVSSTTPPSSSWCYDEPTWHGKYNVNHTCIYVSENPGVRCNWEDSNGLTANESCRATCDATCAL